MGSYPMSDKELAEKYKAQRDKLLGFVKTLHAELFIDGIVHRPEELQNRCIKMIAEVEK